MTSIVTRVLRSLSARTAPRPRPYDRALGYARRPPSKTLVLGLGLARSGKRWLSEIFNRHENAASLAEPYPVLESFYFYCQWNGLAVDHAGFFHRLNADINRLFERHDVVYLASPWLSLGLQQVAQFLEPDAYFFSVREPESVVKSMVNKGWYVEDLVRGANGLPTGSQPFLHDTHHHFSRVTPSGDDYERWQRLTPVGRCAWYWNETNTRIVRELASVPSSRVYSLRLKDIDQNHTFYRNVAARFGLGPRLAESEFEAIKGSMPNIGRRKSPRLLNDVERRELEDETASFAKIYNDMTSAFVQP